MSIIHKRLPYEIVEVNNLGLCRNEFSPGIYHIGWNSKNYEFRTLICVNTNSLSRNMRIVKATITMNVDIEKNLMLQAYSVEISDYLEHITWLTQPQFAFEDIVFYQKMIGCKKYSFDLTGLFKLWQNNPARNYGILLVGSNPYPDTFIQLFVNASQNVGFYIDVDYEEENDVTTKEIFEEIVVDGEGIYHTTLKDLVDYNIKSYFVSNECNEEIQVQLEGSPDQSHFYKGIQYETIEPGGTLILQAIQICRYYQMYINVPGLQTSGRVHVWLYLR